MTASPLLCTIPDRVSAGLRRHGYEAARETQADDSALWWPFRSVPSLR